MQQMCWRPILLNQQQQMMQQQMQPQAPSFPAAPVGGPGYQPMAGAPQPMPGYAQPGAMPQAQAMPQAGAPGQPTAEDIYGTLPPGQQPALYLLARRVGLEQRRGDGHPGDGRAVR